MEGILLGEWLICPLLNTVQNGRQTFAGAKFRQVMVCRARPAGEVVSKDELIENGMANTFVTDEVLTRAVSELRRIMKEKAKQLTNRDMAKNGFTGSCPVQLSQTLKLSSKTRLANSVSSSPHCYGGLAGICAGRAGDPLG